MRPYHDLYILIESHQESQKTLDGELPKLPTKHLGHIGLFDTKNVSSFGLF